MALNLFSASQSADQKYGLPSGFTYAIAGTESNYGRSLGSIGNTFQVTPATSATYGVDGNDPNSVASYISSQFYNNPNSPGYQNAAVSYQLYQNGPNSSLSTPAQYSPTSPFAQWLAGNGGSNSQYPSGVDSWGNLTYPNGNTQDSEGNIFDPSGNLLKSTPQMMADAAANEINSVGSIFDLKPFGEYFVRGVVVLLGLIMVGVGLAMFGKQQGVV